MTLDALLQARNEERLLPGWLASIAPAVDAIVALDDGSQDRTAELLCAHPKVVRLLRNPPGKPWDERANQVALVKAARSHGNWALAVDADERIEAGFASRVGVLLAEAEQGGVTCLCFSLRELWGDRHHYRVDGGWGRKTRYRLFRNDAGHRQFDPRPLHRFWMPLEIARELATRGRHTGCNLYHLTMIEKADRLSRVERYETLDPDRRYQSTGYRYLIDEEGLELKRIPPDRDFLPIDDPPSATSR
jgi:glycosyltransferase involved in cell wall biosynthesis